jgi:hypothetical protein
MVDLSRDQDGCLHARLLDGALERSRALRSTILRTWMSSLPIAGQTGSSELSMVWVSSVWQCYQQLRSIYHAWNAPEKIRPGQCRSETDSLTERACTCGQLGSERVSPEPGTSAMQ